MVEVAEIGKRCKSELLPFPLPMPLSRFTNTALRETLRCRDLRYLPRSQSQEVVEPDFEPRCPEYPGTGSHVLCCPCVHQGFPMWWKVGKSSLSQLKSALARLESHISAFFNISSPAHYTLKTRSPLITQEGPVRSNWHELASHPGKSSALRWERSGGHEHLPCIVAFFIQALFA